MIDAFSLHDATLERCALLEDKQMDYNVIVLS
jgi:hypothetical protein